MLSLGASGFMEARQKQTQKSSWKPSEKRRETAPVLTDYAKQAAWLGCPLALLGWLAWDTHGVEHLQDGDPNLSLRDHPGWYFLTFTITFLDGLVLKHVFTFINVHIKKEKYRLINHRTEGFAAPQWSCFQFCCARSNESNWTLKDHFCASLKIKNHPHTSNYDELTSQHSTKWQYRPSIRESNIVSTSQCSQRFHSLLLDPLQLDE